MVSLSSPYESGGCEYIICRGAELLSFYLILWILKTNINTNSYGFED
jgi:hypothetical protein